MAFQPAQPASSQLAVRPQVRVTALWPAWHDRCWQALAQRSSAWQRPIAAHTGGRRPEPDLQSTSSLQPICKAQTPKLTNYHARKEQASHNPQPF